MWPSAGRPEAEEAQKGEERERGRREKGGVEALDEFAQPPPGRFQH